MSTQENHCDLIHDATFIMQGWIYTIYMGSGYWCWSHCAKEKPKTTDPFLSKSCRLLWGSYLYVWMHHVNVVHWYFRETPAALKIFQTDFRQKKLSNNSFHMSSFWHSGHNKITWCTLAQTDLLPIHSNYKRQMYFRRLWKGLCVWCNMLNVDHLRTKATTHGTVWFTVLNVLNNVLYSSCQFCGECSCLSAGSGCECAP